MKLTLAVALPNFNHGRLLRRSLDAIVGQARRPDKLLILDDGSTDDSAAIIRDYAAKHAFIQPIYKAKNEGVLRACADLYQAIDTDFSYWAAADDFICNPDFFHEAMAAAEADPRVALISGRVKLVSEEPQWEYVARVSQWTENRYATPAETLHEYYEVEPADHSLSSATIYRHAALRAVGGFRPELGPWCDTFALRAITLKHGMFYLDREGTQVSHSATSFSVSCIHDGRKAIDFVARAAWLMRSEPFREYFPAWHVENWTQSYRNILLGYDRAKVLAEMDKSVLQPLGRVRVLRPVQGLLKLLVKTFYRARIRWHQRLLRRYDGDLSCYR